MFHVTAASSPAPITSIAVAGADGDDAADRVGDRGPEEQRPEQVEHRGQHDACSGARRARGHEGRDRVRCIVEPVGEREQDREHQGDGDVHVHALSAVRGVTSDQCRAARDESIRAMWQHAYGMVDGRRRSGPRASTSRTATGHGNRESRRPHSCGKAPEAGWAHQGQVARRWGRLLWRSRSSERGTISR